MATRNKPGTRRSFVQKAERVTRNLEAIDKVVVAARSVLKHGLALVVLIVTITLVIVQFVSGVLNRDPLFAVIHLVTHLGNLAR